MAPRRALVISAALALTLGVPSPALAQEEDDETSTPRVELRHDLAADLFVTGSAAFIAVLYQVKLDEALVPKECRWCDPPAFDAHVRDALVWDDTHSAKRAGDATAFGVAPALAFGLTGLAAVSDGRGDELGVNSLLVAEATLTAVALTQAVKPLVGRSRPAVHYRSEGWEDFPERERNVSFFSGHSSLAFSLAVSSGTIASLRGYRLAPLVWGAGLPVAAFAAYSRIAADAHYLSDVVVGSVVGAGVGFGMPYLLHPALEEDADEDGDDAFAWLPLLLPTPGGATLGATGTF